MNEKIRELAELAELAEEYAYSNGIGMHCRQWRDRFEGKFAELIVRECCELCINNGDREWDGYGQATANKIKEHFVVK
jgi:hypothetical protein